MSKELPGLDIPNIDGVSPYINNWLRFRYKKELADLPITKILIGVTPGGREGFQPVEIDLDKKIPKNIFIVGGKHWDKNSLIKGIIWRACQSIAPGYLDLDMIIAHEDPIGLTSSLLINKYADNPHYTRAPESPKAIRILERVTDKVKNQPKIFMKKQNPHIFLISDLGKFIGQDEFSQETRQKMQNLETLFWHHGATPLLNIVGVEQGDLKMLKRLGINRAITPGIWLHGEDGVFWTWNNKDKNYTERRILPFDF